MSSVRKLKHSIRVVFLWLHYFLKSKDKLLAIADFKVWGKTTFLKNDLLSTGEILWLNFPALRWLRKYIKADMQVFEWGSGASTVFFPGKVKSLVSIEHDLEWFKKVKAKIDDLPSRNIYLKYIPADRVCEPAHLSRQEADLYKSSAPSFEEEFFYHYARSILDYPEASFDIILVDGRARAGCLQLARDKVKKGGVIILDDSDRKAYQSCMKLFKPEEWEILDFYGPAPNSPWPAFWQTRVFIKR